MGTSFIIPAYNSAEFLTDAIASIINGNLIDGDEIVVIDDASTDNTLAVAISLATKYSFIKVLQHKVNKGSAAAGRNTGIENAANDLIFCLDSDNVLEKNSVMPLREFLLEHQLDAAAFGEIRYFSKDRKNIEDVWHMDFEISFLSNINRSQRSPCSSGNYLFTRQSWLKAGRYNEGVGGAMDSWAFGVAQLASDSKMKTLPGSFYYHRRGYESTYVREIKKMNLSLSATRVLLPYLYLLDEQEIDYILSARYRNTWFENLPNRSLRQGATEGYTKSFTSKLKAVVKNVTGKT